MNYQFVFQLNTNALNQFASDLTKLASGEYGDTLNLSLTTKEDEVHMTFLLRDLGPPTNAKVH